MFREIPQFLGENFKQFHFKINIVEKEKSHPRNPLQFQQIQQQNLQAFDDEIPLTPELTDLNQKEERQVRKYISKKFSKKNEPQKPIALLQYLFQPINPSNNGANVPNNMNSDGSCLCYSRSFVLSPKLATAYLEPKEVMSHPEKPIEEYVLCLLVEYNQLDGFVL